MKYLFLLLLTMSCSRFSDPGKVLKNFVDMRFSTESISKENFMENLESPLLEKWEELSEEGFKEFLGPKPGKLLKFKILQKDCGPLECALTYLVKYETYKGPEKAFVTETKKVAQMKNIDGAWKIAKVSHIKTYHDSKVPIETTP